jgi:serine/threonine-protein kinase
VARTRAATGGTGPGETRISQPPPPAYPAKGTGPGGRAPSTSEASVEVDAEVGEVIDGKYEVLEVLGEGGMGQVLAARHVELGQKVALKFMSPAIMEIPGAAERFTREAQAVAKLRSEHVCRVLDIGVTDSGARYIVIEYLQGSDLGDLLAERGQIDAGEAMGYIIQACDALGEAHDAGIVHRDIKPANLFVDESREGKPVLKVLDFGISKNLGSDPNMIVTATNALMGSPMYMSPEQLLSPKEVDTRSDIWSLGVVLHELIVGKPPYYGQSMPEVVAQIINERTPPAATVSEEIAAPVREIIVRCLERDPVRRFATTSHLADALRDAREALGEIVPSDEPSRPVVAPAPSSSIVREQPREMPWVWIGAAIAAAALGVLALIFFLPGDDGAQAQRVAPAAEHANPTPPASVDTPASSSAAVAPAAPESTDAAPPAGELVEEGSETPSIEMQPDEIVRKRGASRRRAHRDRAWKDATTTAHGDDDPRGSSAKSSSTDAVPTLMDPTEGGRGSSSKRHGKHGSTKDRGKKDPKVESGVMDPEL